MRSLLLLLAACAPGAPLPAQLPPPTGDFALTVGPLVAGTQGAVSVSGAPPGARVHVVGSTASLGAGPCPPVLNGRCAELRNPIAVLGDAVVGANGRATLTFALPAGLPAGDVAFQAAVLGATVWMSNPAPAWIHPLGTPFSVTADLDGDGFSWSTGDCYDTDATVFPDAVDPLGDGADRSCDGVDGMDRDRDGHAPPVIGGDDCDDHAAATYAGAADPLGDGVDQDCDGADGQDADHDGFRAGVDCDDHAAATFPGAADAFGDGVDQDCDGRDGADRDGDGVVGGLDCDDGDPAIRPGAAEVCDGVDQDCDAAVDDGVLSDGAGCRDAGRPPPAANASTVHLVTRTQNSANAGSDTVGMEICLSPTACYALGNPNWNDFEAGNVDVKVVEGLSLPRASIDRLRLRLTGGGTDAWRPDCVHVVVDGEPVSCSAGPGAYFGSSAGELSDWTDPAGLHLACTTCDADPITHGPYPGAVTGDVARLWFRADATRRTEVRVVPHGGDLASAPVIAVRYPSHTRDFTEVVEVHGVSPGTSYDYRVTAAGGPAHDGSFTTPPAGADHFTFAFGSCSKDDAQPIFSAIEALDPDFFLFGGDNHYGNTNDLSDLRQFYRWAHSRPERAAMMRDRPIVATWDDHDYVGNNTIGTAPGKDKALRAFKEYWANVSYGQPAHEGVYSTWAWGDTELFLLDDRYWRAMDDGILGAVQTAWLEDQLRASNATFKLLVDGSVWSPEYVSDSWGAFPDSFDRLTAFIRDEAIEGVVLMSGDVHRSELRRIPGAPGGYTLPEIVSSPMANSNSPCANAPSLVACEDSGHYFVSVEIDTTAPDPTLLARVHDEAGAVLHSWTVYRSELQNPPRYGDAVHPDFDGDGYADLAVGSPGTRTAGIFGAGAANVLYGTSSGLNVRFDQAWDQDSAGMPGAPEANDRMGASLVGGDFDGDGFDDLVIGGPGEAIGAVSGAGHVQVLYGGTGRLSTVGVQDWYQGAGGLAGAVAASEDFGEALAVGDFDGDGFADLAVGVPDEGGAGMVQVLYGSAAGLSGARDQSWDQANTGPGSANEAGDSYGAALAAGDFDGDGFDDLAVGHPGEDLGATADAGMLTVLYGSGGGLVNTRDQEWHQDTAGVPGTAEAGDAMAGALATGDLNGDGYADLAIGAPSEDIGGAPDAGYVILLLGGPGGLSAAGVQDWTLTIAALGLTAGTDDALGQALALCDVDGDGLDDLVAGAPGRTVGGAAGAGTVLVLRSDGVGPAAALGVELPQDPHPETASEAGDGHGGSVSCGDYDGDGDEEIAVGARGEAIGAVVGAGMVMVYWGGPGGPLATDADAWHKDKTGVEGAVATDEGFGVVPAR